MPRRQPKRGRLWPTGGSRIRLRPTYRNHVWAYDLMAARTHDGRPLRLLTVVDEYTRQCLAIKVARRIRADDVLSSLTELFVAHGSPAHPGADNGPQGSPTGPCGPISPGTNTGDRSPSDAEELTGVVRLTQSLLEEQSQRRVLLAVPSRRAAKVFYSRLQELEVPYDNRAIDRDELDDLYRLARAYSRLVEEPNNSVAAATAIVLNCAPTTRRLRSRELLELGYRHGERIASLLNSGLVLGGPLEKGIKLARLNLEQLQESENIGETLVELTGCTSADTMSDLEEASASGEILAIEPGRVTVMTVHSCKGLQVDITILPSVDPGEYERDLIGARKEERRRLLYAGITRAIDKVYLTFSRRLYGPKRYGDTTGGSARKHASCFIDDICDCMGIQP